MNSIEFDTRLKQLVACTTLTIKVENISAPMVQGERLIIESKDGVQLEIEKRKAGTAAVVNKSLRLEITVNFTENMSSALALNGTLTRLFGNSRLSLSGSDSLLEILKDRIERLPSINGLKELTLKRELAQMKGVIRSTNEDSFHEICIELITSLLEVGIISKNE